MRVVDQLEEYYLRYTLLETILDAAKVRGWRRQYEELLPYAPAKESARRIFRPIRERILDAPDLTTAVHEMLKDIREIDPKDSS